MLSIKGVIHAPAFIRYIVGLTIANGHKHIARLGGTARLFATALQRAAPRRRGTQERRQRQDQEQQRTHLARVGAYGNSGKIGAAGMD